MVFDFCDGGKGYFYNFPIRTFHLDAGGGERLRRLHAANDAPNTLAVERYNLNIVFAV